MNPSVPLDPHALLEHGEFLHALARRLVLDDHHAEDAVQETYVRALRSPPQRSEVRSWLAIVLRNLVRNRHRSEGRRSQREHEVAHPVVVPSTEEIVQREALRHRVVTAVLALEEPYRSTVLLRYFENLGPAVIARNLGIPAATVRTRLSRALARLREDLDAEYRGDRGRWVAFMSPLARGAGDSPAAFAVVLPLSVMLMKKLLLAAGILVVLASVLVLAISPGGNTPEPPPSSMAAADGHDESRGRVPAEAPATLRALDREMVAVSPAAPSMVFPAQRGRGDLDAILLRWGWEPLAGAQIVVRATPGPMPAGFELEDDRNVSLHLRTDETGCLRHRDLPTGPYLLQVMDGEGRLSDVACFLIEERPLVSPQEIHVSLGTQHLAVWVRVVDGEAKPVAGADVELVGQLRADHRFVGFSEKTRVKETTDAHGFVRFPEVVSGLVRCMTTDERSGWAEVGVRTAMAVITVGVHGVIEGRILGASEAELAGASVRARGSAAPGFSCRGGNFEYMGSVHGTTFRVEGLPAAKYEILLQIPSGLRMDLPARVVDGRTLPGLPAPSVAEVRSGHTTNHDLRVTRGGRLGGRVMEAGGRPVPGATVLLCKNGAEEAVNADLWELYGHHGVVTSGMRSPGPLMPGHPVFDRIVTTDAEGVYSVVGLHPGKYLVDVRAGRLSRHSSLDVKIDDEHPVELSHVLEPAGVLQGVIEEGYLATLEVVRIGETQRRERAALRGAFFSFPGLPAGDYALLVYTGAQYRRVDGFKIEAGRTTWVDLRRRGEYVTNGRVVGPDGPVPGVLVRSEGDPCRTDERGEVTFRNWRKLSPVDHLDVALDGLVPGHRFYLGQFGTGERPVDLVVTGHSLEIRTSDAEEVPIPARVRLIGSASTRREAGGEIVDGRLVRRASYVDLTFDTDAGGRFRVQHVPPGRYSVTATFANGAELIHRKKENQVSVPATTSLTIRAPATGRLFVFVKDAAGAPAPRVPVRVDSGEQSLSGFTDVEGRIHWKAVNAGPIVVEARPEREPRGGRAVASPLRFELLAGESREVVLVY